MEIAIAVNFGNAHIHLKADTLEQFKIGMAYLDEQGILTRNGGQPADTAMMANVGGQVLAAAQATQETKAEEKPKRAAKAPTKKEETKADPAPEVKEEPKAAESEAPAVTKEDVMNAVSAYSNRLVASGLSEADVIAKIKSELYSTYGIKRAGELPEARWGEFVAEVNALTEAVGDAAQAEDETLL